MWYIYFFPLQSIPLTLTKGKGFSRVWKSLPWPLPPLTLPITPRGFKTPGNPYCYLAHNKVSSKMSISNIIAASPSHPQRWWDCANPWGLQFQALDLVGTLQNHLHHQCLHREMFISPNHVKVATSRPTMFKVTAEGTSISQFPVPACVRESGIIPDGYSVGWYFNRQRLSILY